MLGKIAWRNLWRNKTRTAIVVSAIAFSYGLMLFMFGIADDSYQEMGDAVVSAVGGHILVHGDGYWDFPTGGQVVDNPAGRRADIEQFDAVDAISERVLAYGLVGTAGTNEGAQILGVRPEDEQSFYDVEDRLEEGAFFSGERDNPLVLSRDQADDLGVEIGDRVVVTATDLDGDVARGLFFVDGITRAMAGQAGEGRAYVEYGALQEVLGYGDAATQIGVRLRDDEMRQSVAQRLRQDFEGLDLEVLTWDQAVPEFLALIEFDEAFTYFYVLIIMIIVALGITNTFLMAVMERIREIGLLSALGLTPRRIGIMILVETAIVTVLGMLIGLGLGLAGHFWMATYGLDLGALFDLEMEMAGVSLEMMQIHSHIDPGRWIVGSVVIFGFIVASSLYPAWRATQMAPSEAMRFYE